MSLVIDDLPAERSAPVELVDVHSGETFRLHGEGPTFHLHKRPGESEELTARALAARLNGGEVYVRGTTEWHRLLAILREHPGETDHYDAILEASDHV